LKNTIAEVGIYVLNGKKKRGATRFVMPLYVTVSRALHFFLFPLALPGRKQQQHYIFCHKPPCRLFCKITKLVWLLLHMRSKRIQITYTTNSWYVRTFFPFFYSLASLFFFNHLTCYGKTHRYSSLFCRSWFRMMHTQAIIS